MAAAPEATRRSCFEAAPANHCWQERKQRPRKPQMRQQSRLEHRARDRRDGASAWETQVSRVIEDPSESVESEGYSGPSDPTEGAGAHASGRTRFPRLDAALERVGPEPLTQMLGSLTLQSLTQVDKLQTLHQIVLALEGAAQGTTMKR
jgi:hypothetical protein